MKLECSFDTTVLLSRQISICLFAGGSFFRGFHYLEDHYCFITNSVGIWRFLSPYTFPSLGDFFGSYQNLLLLTKVEHMVAFFPSSRFFTRLEVLVYDRKVVESCSISLQIFFNCTAVAHPFRSKDFCHWRLKSHQAKHHFQLGENAFLVCELSVYNFISFSTIGTYCKLCLKDYQKMKFLKD